MTGTDITDFFRKNWVYFAIGVALALGLFLAYCAGGKGEVVKQQSRTIDTLQKVGKANEKAADTRVKDEVRIEQQKQELNNALKDATSPDDLRRRRGCAVLQQQGRDVSAISACRRP